LLAVFHFSHGVTGVAVVMVVSTALGTVLNLYFLFREYSRVATPGSEQYELREWITFSTLTFLSNLVVTLLDSIDTILLASFGLSKVAIGQYGAAIRLSPFITIPLQSLNVIFSPTIAELHSKGEQKKLEDMFKIVTKWAITFSLPICLVASLFSPYILGLSGAGYMPAWPLLIAFCFGNLLGAATGSSGSMLLMTGHNKLSFLNSVVAIVVNVGLGIWLTPLYGAMGTAVSTGLAVGVLNIMRILQVRIVLKMQPYRLDTLKPLAAGLISSALTGALLYLFYSYGQSHRVYVLIGHAIISFQLVLMPIFLAIYVGLLMLFKLSPEDEIVLSALRKKFLRGQKRKKKLQEA
jgi:O-antigen/teichoic acid export membrane protein